MTSRNIRSGCRAITGMPIGVEFEPHGIQYRECTGKTQPQYPAEIPHGSSSIARVTIGFNIGARHRPAHDPVDPTRIGQNDGQKDDHRNQHDAERPMTARGIPHRQTAAGMR